MLSTLKDRPYLFSNDTNTKCRLCGIGDESLHHILNCYVISSEVKQVNHAKIFTDEPDITYMEEVSSLVKQFFDEEEAALS